MRLHFCFLLTISRQPLRRDPLTNIHTEHGRYAASRPRECLLKKFLQPGPTGLLWDNTRAYILRIVVRYVYYTLVGTSVFGRMRLLIKKKKKKRILRLHLFIKKKKTARSRSFKKIKSVRFDRRFEFRFIIVQIPLLCNPYVRDYCAIDYLLLRIKPFFTIFFLPPFTSQKKKKCLYLK